jgi:pre-mRNA-splicing factor ISY1
MRQKHYWEIRIRELGGSFGEKIKHYHDIEGKELPGMPGYRYYGAAKELPGVRELFSAQAEEVAQFKQKKYVYNTLISIK